MAPNRPPHAVLITVGLISSSMLSFGVLLGATQKSVSGVRPSDISHEVEALKDELIRLRSDLHAHPELGFQETRTAGIVADYQERLGLKVERQVAQTGVVATLGHGGNKTLLVRADMDALPIEERNDVPYRSQTPGIMHACGHDGHTAIALVTAKLLNASASSLKGQVKFVFQPAEEGPGGAKPMIEGGVMRDPEVTAAIGFHLYNKMELGTIGVRPGAALASADQFTVTISGKGGHGAMPHLSIDPIVLSGYVITALQSIVSRQIDPLSPAVVSIGTIRGGDRFNVIADSVEMTGTVRTYDVEVQRKIMHSMKAILDGVTGSMGGSAKLDYQMVYPPVINDVEMSKLVREAAQSVVGANRVIEHSPAMAADDMAYFFQEVPGCYFFIGSANAERGLDFPHHHPRFDFDEDALLVGVETLVRSVRQYLN